jgi:asparagine synthase (glutamine-hydrolysing)
VSFLVKAVSLRILVFDASCNIMCGIAALWDKNNANVASTEAALEAISRRGPDARCDYVSGDGRLWLGHTRLSILDLSDAADQPFHSTCGRYVAVYNGEVYNFRELANKHALALRTQSDTEVVVELFARLGPGFVTELNGMFALAIYDTREEALYLFRDRLGIKPLYYSLRDGAFAFASELPALKALCPESPHDPEALAQYLHRGYVPEPLTFYRDFKKFPAGSRAVYQNGKLDIAPYWQAQDAVTVSVHSDEKQVLARTEELLRDSVRLRLIADVPVGTFLSGGADSGLVSAIAADLHTGSLNTFNVSFEDAVFDETPFAREMAEIIGSTHRNMRVTRADVMSRLGEGMSLVGEPFADSSVFPTTAVSAFAAQYMKVALSGDGGDELFGGYGAYHWAERMSKPHIWQGRKLIAAALRAKGGNRNRRAAQVFDAPDRARLAAHIFSQEQNLFSGKEIEALTGNAFRDPYTPPSFARKLSPAEEQAFFDLTNYLKDDLLVKVDRSSMRHSLEVRVPFLDHRLVEYALNIDPALKIKNGEAKYPVKRIMEKYYPKELIYRKKWGFSVPLEKWMGEKGFTGSKALPLNYREAFDGASQAYFKGDAFLYNRLYSLMNLAAYL